MSDNLYKTVNGEPVVLIEGMALLLGVTVEDIRRSMDEQGTPAAAWKIPPEWQQQGRRIARETMAATGSTAMKDSIDYLAARR